MIYIHPFTISAIIACIVIFLLLKLAKKSTDRSIALVLLSVIILLSLLFHLYMFVLILPYFFETTFTKTCRGLAGKDFTVENLNKLNAKYLWYTDKNDGNVWPIEMGILDTQFESINQKAEPYFRISEKGYDNTWECQIGKNRDSKMKTTPNWVPD